MKNRQEDHTQGDAGQEKRRSGFGIGELLVFVLLICLTFGAIIYGRTRLSEINHQETEEKALKNTAAGAGKIQVTGSDDVKVKEKVETELAAEGIKSVEAETLEETELAAETALASTRHVGEIKESPDAEADGWQTIIFGSRQSSVTSSFQILGLSEAEKLGVGFRETDFLYALSAFLSEHQIRVKKLTFAEEIPCSSPGAAVYRVRLDNRKDWYLIVMFYPDYPGKYQFLLMEDEEDEDAGTTAQSETQAQLPSPQTEAPVKQVEQSVSVHTEQTEAYDATRLTVSGIPETLLNYLANQYELQYSLYDYLYRNGYRGVTSAAVSAYDIDGDNKTATIQFLLSDGQRITGTYRKDENLYVYQ